MLQRCSQATLNARFNSAHVHVSYAGSWVRDALRDPTCASWVATADTAIVGMASACHQDGKAEVALLVEDKWQRRGVGGELLRRLVATERERGTTNLGATMAAERLVVARSLSRKAGVELRCTIARGEAEITAELARGARGDIRVSDACG
jgi:GNAT superfamily N-acetyltransferase